jgi:hypothetical protein
MKTCKGGMQKMKRRFKKPKSVMSRHREILAIKRAHHNKPPISRHKKTIKSERVKHNQSIIAQYRELFDEEN